ncbi:Putative cadmium/zinc-transporting ATPase HMA1 [Durusdinium trenchii]|uniref:Chloroplastic n=1 Tax=Durusdinium trenchii TaxID=1381693 RepID=A0ABP0P402_9DINO
MAESLAMNHVEVGFASTLLGAMVFLMSLTYLTNNSDKDIRRYTYEVISQTIAIFCAVMVFQYINEVTDKAMVHFGWAHWPFLVHMLQMIVWYSALQFHLYYISFQGAVALAKHKFEEVEGIAEAKPQTLSVWTALISLFGTEHIAFSTLHPLDHIEDLQSQMTCWKVLLSHIAGFAAINAFGTLQQSEPWREDWQTATLVVVLASFTMLMIQWYFDEQRRKVAEAWKTSASLYDDRMEEVYHACFVMWLEEAEEPEDNVLALTVSFLSVQAIRYWISGTLPDVEGLDPWALQTTRSAHDIQMLFAVFGIWVF